MPITSLFNLNEKRERSKNSSYGAFCSPKVNPERDISEDCAYITPDSEYLYLSSQYSAPWRVDLVRLGSDS